jgi:hypothetical protein
MQFVEIVGFGGSRLSSAVIPRLAKPIGLLSAFSIFF